MTVKTMKTMRWVSSYRSRKWKIWAMPWSNDAWQKIGTRLYSGLTELKLEKIWGASQAVICCREAWNPKWLLPPRSPQSHYAIHAMVPDRRSEWIVAVSRKTTRHWGCGSEDQKCSDVLLPMHIIWQFKNDIASRNLSLGASERVFAVFTGIVKKCT